MISERATTEPQYRVLCIDVMYGPVQYEYLAGNDSIGYTSS